MGIIALAGLGIRLNDRNPTTSGHHLKNKARSPSNNASLSSISEFLEVTAQRQNVLQAGCQHFPKKGPHTLPSLRRVRRLNRPWRQSVQLARHGILSLPKQLRDVALVASSQLLTDNRRECGRRCVVVAPRVKARSFHTRHCECRIDRPSDILLFVAANLCDREMVHGNRTSARFAFFYDEKRPQSGFDFSNSGLLVLRTASQCISAQSYDEQASEVCHGISLRMSRRNRIVHTLVITIEMAARVVLSTHCRFDDRSKGIGLQAGTANQRAINIRL